MRNSTGEKEFMNWLSARNPHEPEFLQAVKEVAEIIFPFIEDHPKYRDKQILERITEPERVIIFRVPWIDDRGIVQINRGFRIQMNSALGPYKGGLRFHPSVNLSILKFLAFEQCFKNSLTSLSLGAGKGGSDFDPKGKSDGEVMRFCQSFMSELYRHISSHCDVPAGDIGVGGREIGFLFGQYKRLKNEFTGVLTGKGQNWGGSHIRPEATGYGCVYFVEEMLNRQNDGFKGKTVVVSGSGNVAQYAIEKANHLGAKVVAASDTSGYIYDKNGINSDKLVYLMQLKNEDRGRISDYAEKYNCEFNEGTPWHIPCDIALPCATQNELDEKDAATLIKNNVKCVAEGANMPCTPEAVEAFIHANVLYAPGKASNAGGVATSGLEMAQNAIRLQWSADKVDQQLHKIMKDIHTSCVKYGRQNGKVNYLQGANIAGFVRIADAMLDQGIV